MLNYEIPLVALGWEVKRMGFNSWVNIVLRFCFKKFHKGLFFFLICQIVGRSLVERKGDLISVFYSRD